ncbi:probable ATP-binding protein PRP16 [Fusarium torulosum]|uniref:Probable ATP-binding protein PRP16 n=1 Tax=Fusarium torulosum TaxID=33205 RepID=A0AAE8MGK5_9HYPO|nr:probable ATP-binding protein PRP16 [Fusarium torulosum]
MEQSQYRNTTAEEAIHLENGEAHPLRDNQVHSEKYFELLKIRRQLPVSSKRQEFLDVYHQNQTGSGKTTQIPQFVLFDELASKSLIVCTQPRRIAATSVAKRVAAELDVKLGEEVGYRVRFDKRNTLVRTRLSYMTDGMLLQLVKSDLHFKKYGCVIIDEVHERTLSTDLLLALLKRALPHRPDLKVIVMSATANANKLLNFFGQGGQFSIPGRMFPIDIRYLQEAIPDYAHVALHTAKHIHETSADGDILLFMPSVGEIEDACVQLRKATEGLEVLPLYSQLSRAEQDKVFTRSFHRRCIISTNIAETSVTIGGVVYVIDPGLAKESRYNPRTGLESIFTAPISQASARQRAGRAGRTGPAVCYRLYTKDDFDEILLPTTPPSILLNNLSDIVLQLKAMGIADIANFDFLDKPDPEVCFRALEDLLAMDYLDDNAEITLKGKMAANLPVHPVWYNAIAMAHELGCSQEMLTIAAIQSNQHPIFLRPRASKLAADLAHQRFACPVSDHITQLNAVHAYLQTESQAIQLSGSRVDITMREWCSDAFLSMSAIEEVKLIRMQLRKSFADLFKEDPKAGRLESPEYDSNIRKALAWAFSHQVAFIDDGDDLYRVLHFNWHAGIHPDSSLIGINHQWIIYDSFVDTFQQHLTTVTAIEPEWIMDSNNFQELSWRTEEKEGDAVYRMPLAKAAFDEACENYRNSHDPKIN